MAVKIGFNPVPFEVILSSQHLSIQELKLNGKRVTTSSKSTQRSPPVQHDGLAEF